MAEPHCGWNVIRDWVAHQLGRRRQAGNRACWGSGGVLANKHRVQSMPMSDASTALPCAEWMMILSKPDAEHTNSIAGAEPVAMPPPPPCSQ